MSSRFILEIYRLVYGFDKWHSAAHLNSRKYRKIIAEKCRLLKINSIVEIGCGLGFNLVEINCGEMIGVDIDSRVLKAAKKINEEKIKFYDVNEYFDRPTGRPLGLLCFNWIHEIEESKLSEILKKYIVDVD